MRAMKDSGIEWIGKVPDEWPLARIKSCVARRDAGAWGEEANGENENCICLRVADMDYSRLRFKEQENYTVRSYKKEVIDSLKLQKDDILIEKSGGGDKTPVGRAVIFNGGYQAVFANFMERIRCTPNMNPRFMLYVFTTLYQSGYAQNYIKQTTGIQNFDLTSLLTKEYMPLPQYEEQGSIAAFLDDKCGKIDAIITREQDEIEKLKEYKLSVITEAVTKGLNPDAPMKDSGVEYMGQIPAPWNMIRLKFLMSEIIDCPHETPNYSADGAYLVIRTADQDYGFLRPDEAMYRLNENEYMNRIRRMALQKDDIVYGREGERWGLACLVPRDDSYCLGQRMMQMRCRTDQILPAFAMWALNSRYVYLQGSVDTIGSTSPHVNISTMRNYNIPVPPMDEQQRIVEYIAKRAKTLESQVEKKQVLIDKLTEYKKSLIYEVVTGKREV